MATSWNKLNLKIFIPSTGRAHTSQPTAHALYEAEIPFTYVVQSHELNDYRALHLADDIRVSLRPGIHHVRQDILYGMTKPEDMVVMLDDDLTIYQRCKVYTNRFNKSGPLGIQSLFSTIQTSLGLYAHGGIAEKFMAQRRPVTPQYNKRYFHVLCYNKALFPVIKPTYRTRTGEDHDVNLQLLKAGKKNFLLTGWAHKDRPWTDGGCNTWRTPEINEEAHKELAALHSDVITMVEPTRDMTSHGNTSFSLRINWKKAYEIGCGRASSI